MRNTRENRDLVVGMTLVIGVGIILGYCSGTMILGGGFVTRNAGKHTVVERGKIWKRKSRDGIS